MRSIGTSAIIFGRRSPAALVLCKKMTSNGLRLSVILKLRMKSLEQLGKEITVRKYASEI